MKLTGTAVICGYYKSNRASLRLKHPLALVLVNTKYFNKMIVPNTKREAN